MTQQIDATPDPSFWNGIAESYARQAVADPEAFERKIAITRSRMTRDDVVLDIGCGTGSLALRLAPHAAHVHGLDVSTEMIRIARDKARDTDNVTFHVGALDDGFTAIAPGRLNGLCAYSLLHLLPDRKATLDRAFQLLRPGGFFVSSTVCLKDSWVPYAPVLTAMRWMKKAPMVKIISKRELEDEIRAAGFVDVVQPDVGAASTIAFVVASKPRSGS